ncbi:MAG: flagellar biosynthesis protein FlhB [Sulfuricurvum sp.]
MAAEDEGRTEDPTQKQIEKARADGNVPNSREISGMFTLLVAIAIFILFLPYIYANISTLARYYFSLIGSSITQEMLLNVTIITMRELFFIVMPVAFAVAIAGIVGNVSQFGFLFSTKAIEFKPEKLDFIKGAKNLFSLKKILDALKTTSKSFMVLGVAFYFFYEFTKELPMVTLYTLADQLVWLAKKAIFLALVIYMIMLAFALVDLVVTRRRYTESLKMTKQQIKDEHKNAEGDPKVKAKIRTLQMQAARKRMMSSVAKADVVITNPTHYAVALKYDELNTQAPVVVAKGVDHIAFAIRKIAKENGVHIVQNPPLAREIYAKVDIDRQIPSELFSAVAEVLAYVYKMNKK